jgi:hypothetical protein
VIGPLRAVVLVAGALVLAAGFQLFVLTDHTERFFAWTVEPPVTGATLGAFYWTSLGLLAASYREPVWARVRVAFPGVFAFTSLTLLATLVHLDRFHLGADDPITLIATWAWVAVYGVVPPALVAVLLMQRRAPGSNPPRVAPVAVPARSVMGIVALAWVGVGAALVAIPGRAASLWPWPLTDLTARAVGAWLIGMGLVVGGAVVENDWTRLRPAALSSILLAGLQATALVRYADQVAWGSIEAWAYVGTVVALAAVGISGLRAPASPGAAKRAWPTPSG